MQCTWKDCKYTACHPQKRKDGAVWANLCEEHNKVLTDAVTDRNVKKLLGAWVKASGGAKKLAEKM